MSCVCCDYGGGAWPQTIALPSLSRSQCLVAEWRRVRSLLTFLASTGCSLFSCKAPSVDTAVWQRQGRGPGQPACWLYRPSRGAGPGGTPSSLRCSAHCALEPPMEIRLILQTRPLSCLQCESSARGRENDFWLNTWEWGQEMSSIPEVDACLWRLEVWQFVCPVSCTHLETHPVKIQVI